MAIEKKRRWRHTERHHHYILLSTVHPRGSTCLEYTEPHTSTDYENRGALEGEELRLEPTNQIPPHGTVWAPNVPSSIKGRGRRSPFILERTATREGWLSGSLWRLSLDWPFLPPVTRQKLIKTKTKTYQDKSFSRHKTKAGITIKVKTSQDFVDDSSVNHNYTQL